jgi:beta-lactamase regulating signal transducer with metallopeptidase domain
MELTSISVLMARAGHWPAAASRFSDAAASAAVTAVWQGALLAAVLAIVLRLSPRISATHRFIVWAAGFSLAAVLPFFPMLASLAASPLHSGASEVAGASGGPWLQVDSRWSFAIAALWIAASIFRAVRLAMQALHLRKLGKTASTELPESCPFASGRIRVAGRGLVRICTTKLLESPGAIGFFNPRILIPEWLKDRLTTAEFQQIVLHEAEHLRRRDDWTNLIEKICLAVFPLNPVLWWMDRKLLMEREMACDEGVIRATQQPRSYAACLTSLAERKLQQRAEVLSLGAWRRRPELVSRVQSILAPKNTPGPWAIRLLVSMIFCGLLVGSAELMRSPQLIAFVPSQTGKVVQADARLVAEANPEPSLSAAAMRAPASGPASGKQTPFLTKTRAVLPASRPAKRVVAPVSVSENRRDAETAKASLPATSSQTGKNAPRGVLAKAELPGSGENADGQQWIIFAAWHELRLNGAPAEGLAQQSALESDYQTDGEAQVNGVPANVVVIEQLFLKVVPVVYQPIPATKAQIRAGWLVLQL